MCGRFSLTTPPETVAEMYGLIDLPAMAPRYNIAPTQPVAAVVEAGEGHLQPPSSTHTTLMQ